MKILWTDTAERHLDQIYDYIAMDSPERAKAVVGAIVRRSVQIAQFPLSGRMVPEYHHKEIREMIEPPYRIIYSIHNDRIEILSVLHSSRVFPSEDH